ncbi:Di-copper centre-containing protein [Hypoxylon sp. FL1150]|nr:Di-copper centre-containing protein [Hypoxylon sp. FL1150]
MSDQIISTVGTRHRFMTDYWTWEKNVFIDSRPLLIGHPYPLQIALMRIIRRLIPWIVFSCAPATALPTSWPRDDGGQAQQQQQQQPVPVTGVTTGLGSGTGERPARWEVSALQEKGGPRWDLYVLGLAALQNKTETDERSHFSIAGIHGRPYAPYNGVGPVPGSPDGGYCPHGETQFIAWHRPYVALYEQALGSEIQRIAADYEGGNASVYRDVAETFRLPYWDWFANTTLPAACVPENVTVVGPRGLVALRNPLYSYRWPEPLNRTLFPGSQDWAPETTRASDKSHPDFSPDAVNKNLAQNAGQIKDLVYRTFTQATTYDQMSSMMNSAGVSFEAPHNIIHNAVGGSFASLDLTAFDSLFMLHHANVDRLAALWTVVHPDATHQTESYQTRGLYGTARGDTVTAESPLKPFYQADGRTLHTGVTAAALEPFGYTYPELQDWERSRQDGDGDRERARRGVVAYVNAVYYNGGGGGGGGGGNGNGTREGGEGAPGEEGEEWFVQVAVNRSSLELPCSINILVGDEIAGHVPLLTMPRQGIAHAEIPLRRAVQGLGVNTTDRAAVGEALRGQLHVEIKGSGETSIDAKNIVGLEMNLVAATVTTRGNEFEFPEYGERGTYVKILPAS